MDPFCNRLNIIEVKLMAGIQIKTKCANIAQRDNELGLNIKRYIKEEVSIHTEDILEGKKRKQERYFL